MKTKLFPIIASLFVIANSSFAFEVNGICGENLLWSLNTDDRVLYISGYGQMLEWEEGSLPPWYQYRDFIDSVNISNEVSTIGAYAFYNFTNITSITIPENVWAIRDYAFYGCSSLENVVIPNNYLCIQDLTFAFCSSIKKLVIPERVTCIYGRAFWWCTGMTTIQFPETLTSIGDKVLYHCSGLTELVIPASVTNINVEAFAYCSGLTSVTCKAVTPPTIAEPSWFGKEAFLGVDKTIPLYVPFESVPAYQAADQWKDFTNIQAIPGTEPEPEPETEEVNCNIRYVDKNSASVYNEQVTFHVPEAPIFEGFTFLRWEFVGGAMSDGLTIQAVYTANTPTSAPEVYTNPANPAQKLIREGNVYILKGENVYSIQGKKVR